MVAAGSDAGLVIACVEDHEPDAILIRQALEGISHLTIAEFYRARDLQSLEGLRDKGVDVVLLDLGLPDSAGLTTIARARAIMPATPLVVLTGDSRSGVDAIAAGADDYVDKDHMGHGYLARTLAHAVERHRLTVGLAQMESEQELARIGGAAESSLPVASALVGNQRLAEADPGFSRHCVDTFARVVLDRLAANAAGGSDEAGQRALHSLSRQMAARNAGPDDVVTVLTDAVDSRRGQLRPAQFGPFVRECRLALIELMGHLMAHYRAHVPVFRAQAELIDAADDAGDASDESESQGEVLGLAPGRTWGATAVEDRDA